MKPDIIEKIRKELTALPIRDEKTVLYVLAEARKLFDLDETLKGVLPTLKFYCDWALHPRLDRGDAKQFLEALNPVLTFEGNWTKSEFSKLQQNLTLQTFREQLASLLRGISLDTSLCDAEDNWSAFLEAYSGVVQDAKIAMKANKKITPRGALKLAVESITIRPFDSPDLVASSPYPMEWLVKYADGRSCRVAFGNTGPSGDPRIHMTVPLGVENMTPEYRRRKMERLYFYKTTIGPFYIVKMPDNTYHPVYGKDEFLGSYSTPDQAARGLADGHTYSLSSGVDTATLGIPDDLAEWGHSTV